MTNFNSIRKLFEITEDNGFSVEEMTTLLQHPNAIPKVLYDYYLQLGKIKSLNQTQDKLLEPNQLKYSKNKKFLIFYAENQWACVWGIHKNDLNKANPLVFMSYDEKEWVVENEKLSDFLNAMSNLQATFALPYTAEEFLMINESEFESIKCSYKKRDFKFTRWIGIEFYGNNDNDVITVMKNENNYDLVYASANEEQFEAMQDILNKLGN
ncbi:hypothetical protein [Flavobacterium piscis]|uniref:SMI1/KNR4 family protein n=1 Tax=Flavobacterium piscis TaxID=1114874 RepID=A0ABU1Y4I9_9FLAO|nr:hypothetical protein [Flavobacterium piscis]MDR7209142.1 hypothetical protein [Flavobacterium piscis]